MLQKVFLILAFLAVVPAKENDFVQAINQLFREPPPPEPKTNRAVELRTIEQRVNNFNAQNTDTYLMRYYENGDYFQPGGPIFIFVGGEWSISPPVFITGGHMFDMARNMSGMMYYTEHRFYGQSHPFPDDSTPNLQYLSIDQALADLASFIVRQKENPGMENSPVILVGGSYSATMVTWFRQKYPHLTAGVWASSAPLLAQVNFVEYMEVAGAAIRHVGGNECYERIARAFSQMEELVQRGDGHILRERFNLCNDLDTPLNSWAFFLTIVAFFAARIQNHQDGDIEYYCSLITNPEISDDIEAYATFIMIFIDGDSCLDTDYESAIEYYLQTEWEATGIARLWLYQTCSEFGWFQTSDSVFHPFGSSFPVDLNYNMCRDVFGDIFNTSQIHLNVARTNTMYGGRNPGIVNVIFTQGLIDPWRSIGINTGLSYGAPAVVVPGASHSMDLGSISDNDTAEMRALKLHIEQLIRQWIAEWNNASTPF